MSLPDVIVIVHAFRSDQPISVSACEWVTLDRD
jgi:hypothetical protein